MIPFDNVSRGVDVFEARNDVRVLDMGEGTRAMSVMQSEVYEAFRAIDIPEEKALKAATALSKRDGDVSGLKSELLVIRWMMVFVLAFQVVIFAKLFMH